MTSRSAVDDFPSIRAGHLEASVPWPSAWPTPGWWCWYAGKTPSPSSSSPCRSDGCGANPTLADRQQPGPEEASRHGLLQPRCTQHRQGRRCPSDFGGPRSCTTNSRSRPGRMVSDQRGPSNRTTTSTHRMTDRTASMTSAVVAGTAWTTQTTRKACRRTPGSTPTQTATLGPSVEPGLANGLQRVDDILARLSSTPRLRVRECTLPLPFRPATRAKRGKSQRVRSPHQTLPNTTAAARAQPAQAAPPDR
jgi:hypothetical protein